MQRRRQRRQHERIPAIELDGTARPDPMAGYRSSIHSILKTAYP